MIKINSEIIDGGKQALDVRIAGNPRDVLPEFGAVIRTVCSDFMKHCISKDNIKQFAEMLAMQYAREIHAAYLEITEENA